MYRTVLQVLECDEFYGLSPDQVTVTNRVQNTDAVLQVSQLIASDTITVPSEEKVFESVIAWIQVCSGLCYLNTVLWCGAAPAGAAGRHPAQPDGTRQVAASQSGVSHTQGSFYSMAWAILR